MREEPIPGALGELILERGDPYIEQKLDVFEKHIRAEKRKIEGNAFVVLHRMLDDDRVHIVVFPGILENRPQASADTAQTDVSVVDGAGLGDALVRASRPDASASGARAPSDGLAPPSGGVGLRRK